MCWDLFAACVTATRVLCLQATPDKSFNIFDAGSVQNARDTLKANVEKAANEARDPAERVFPIGRPGETQEVRPLSANLLCRQIINEQPHRAWRLLPPPR